MMNDSELLQAWVMHRDEAAFADLVRRHVDLVYGSARRQLGPSPLVEDVVQAVFLVLARKAESLRPEVVLSGWLFKTTRFVAARALLAERRRAHHESAFAMNPAAIEEDEPSTDWTEVAAHLDASLGALQERDRDALVLRFLEGLPLRGVGDRLGVSEDAARMQVQRALENLRTLLVRKGVVLTAISLLSFLATLSSMAAPAELAGRVVSGLESAATTSGALSSTLARDALQELSRRPGRRWIPTVAVATVLLVAVGVLGTLTRLQRRGQDGSPTVSAEGRVANSVAVTPRPLAPRYGANSVTSKVLLNVRAAADNQPVPARLVVSYIGEGKFIRGLFLQCDERGSVEIPIDEPALEFLNVWVSAAGFVPRVVRWRRHEFDVPVVLHTCRLDPGQTLTGTVLDESGRPVAGARIEFDQLGFEKEEREAVAFLPELTGVTSDPAGRFRSDQLPALLGISGAGYTVHHPGFVLSHHHLTGPASLRSNHVVVLHAGINVLGRVIQSDGSPASGVRIASCCGPFRERLSADDGGFSIGPFDPGPLQLECYVAGEKFAENHFTVSRAAPPVVLQLKGHPLAPSPVTPPTDSTDRGRVLVQGAVVNATTGLPVPTFTVRSLDGDSGRSEFLGDASGGAFEWRLPASGRLRTLRVEANGYEPWTAEPRRFEDGMEPFQVRLVPSADLTGVIRFSDGRPVADAWIGLKSADAGDLQLTGEGLAVEAGSAPHTTSDAEGRFRFAAQKDPETLLVAHERGAVWVPVSAAKAGVITLPEWGGISGELRIAGLPAANEELLLTEWIDEHEPAAPTPQIQVRTRTDAQGRFRFPKVPAGVVAIRRFFDLGRKTPHRSLGLGPQQRVEVREKQTTDVLVGETGRAVVGSLRLSRPIAGHQWMNEFPMLVLEAIREDLRLIPIPSSDSVDTETLRAMRFNGRRQLLNRRYFLVVQPDGTFRLEDIPPGSYELRLRVSEPSKRPPEQERLPIQAMRERGVVKQAIHVPGLDESPVDKPLDLGVITVSVRD